MHAKARYQTLFNVYNTLAKHIEPITIASPGQLNWYACGPTVYDDVHIGHLRCYLALDCFRRIIEHYEPGITVQLVVGITDIDDKIIKRSREKGIRFLEMARYYEKSFLNDLELFNIQYPTRYARVSDHIADVDRSIDVLVQGGYAYKGQGGQSIYFSIDAYRKAQFSYPKFRTNVSNRLTGNCPDKRNPADFAIWKRNETDESWPSTWGQGRPGWHIECSSIIQNVFGKNGIDIHSGGIDLEFPHHSNEVAISEASRGTTTWCPMFIHSGLVLLNETKMSKSLGNIISAKELLSNCPDPDSFRYLCLLSHYRANMRFSFEELNEASKGLHRLKDLISLLEQVSTVCKRNLADKFTAKDKWLHEQLCNFYYLKKELLLNDFRWHLLWRAILKPHGIYGIIGNYCGDGENCHPILLKKANLILRQLLESFGFDSGTSTGRNSSTKPR